MVGEVKLLITRSWVQNLGLPDERSNRETSRRICVNSVYLVNLQGLPFIQLKITVKPPRNFILLRVASISS